jgi:hypothetical protein
MDYTYQEIAKMIGHSLYGPGGATRTASMLDDCRQRLGLPPIG